jgi:hypothetical protein
MVTNDVLVDDFLEHHGIRGQKWGIRKKRRAENFRQVGTGKATRMQKIRAGRSTGPIDLVKGGGFKGGAARKAKRITNANQLVESGHRTTRATLTRLKELHYQDIIPTSKSATNTKAAVGASVAGFVLANYGYVAVKKLAKSKF